MGNIEILIISKFEWGCGHFSGLAMQPDCSSVDTPMGSYFREMF